MTFDSHAHIFTDDVDRYPIAPLGGSLRPGEMDDPVSAERLLRLLDRHGVDRAVVVQRAYIYGYDNAYVVDAAARYPDRLRAVAAIDAMRDDAAAQVRHWVGERGAVGIRLTEPHRGADTAWFNSPPALAAWETAAELGVPVRLHFFRWNREYCLPEVVPLLSRFSRTPVVIDHLSNLSAEDGPPDYGVDAPLAALIDFPNLCLLFSTINLARLAAEGLPAAPVIERVVEAFGAGRVMWGSDIGQSRVEYADMLAQARSAVASLPADDRRHLLHETGTAVYG